MPPCFIPFDTVNVRGNLVPHLTSMCIFWYEDRTDDILILNSGAFIDKSLSNNKEIVTKSNAYLVSSIATNTKYYLQRCTQ